MSWRSSWWPSGRTRTGKDIKDPALAASITGKRREALTAAFALKQEKVPFN
jgi:hypothetical protein